MYQYYCPFCNSDLVIRFGTSPARQSATVLGLDDLHEDDVEVEEFPNSIEWDEWECGSCGRQYCPEEWEHEYCDDCEQSIYECACNTCEGCGEDLDCCMCDDEDRRVDEAYEARRQLKSSTMLNPFGAQVLASVMGNE